MKAFKRSFEWGLPLLLTFAAPRVPTAPSPRQAAHVRLVNEGAPGPLYECDPVVCDPARVDDPSRKNLGRMDFYVLPEGCVELRSALLRREGPGVDVECGPEGSSTSYRCEAGVCDLLVPAGGDGGASSWPIQLPADCGGRVHEIAVLGATSGTPEAFVECDASSGPVGEP